jgi:death-on-curing family protein
VRHLAAQGGISPDEALRILRGASFRVASVNDLIAASRVGAAIAILRDQMYPASPRPQLIELQHPAESSMLPSSPVLRARDAAKETREQPRTRTPRRDSTAIAQQERVRFLTEDEVLAIHYALVDFFAKDGDPIAPAGVREINLLASALLRPRTSIGDREKYRTLSQKAAALFHSLAKNHPFHNGNKRTAFVGTLSFLDRNGWHLRAEVDDEEIID